MNKKDYIKLAQAIKENLIPVAYGRLDNGLDKILATNRFINELCSILAADNPKFDKVKFLEACK